MIKYIFLSLLPLSLFGEAFLSFYTFNANNAVSLKNIASNWSGDYKTPKGSFKVLHFGNLKFGYKSKEWQMAYVIKSALYIKTSSDFADIMHSVKQSENLEKNRIYNLSFNLNSYGAYGVEFSKNLYRYEKEKTKFFLKGSFSILKGFFLQNASIKGLGFANDFKNYSIYADMNYYYSKNYFYNLSVKRPSSLGYDTSLSLFGSFRKYNLSINLKNLLGYLFWKNSPYSDVHLKASSKIDGKYNPSVYGYEGKRSFKQRIPLKIDAKLSYNFDKFRFFVKNISYKKFNLPSLGMEKRVGKIKGEISYEKSFKTFTIALKHKNFSFSFGFENPNLKKSKSLSLGLSLFFKF